MTDGPAGFVVTVDEGDRIHFVDWSATRTPENPQADAAVARTEERVSPPAGVLLVHGLGQTVAVWAPIARRLAPGRSTIAMDLRGHGLSDAPTEDGAYALAILADDVVAVAEGSGLLDVPGHVTLVGHGFGAIVAATAAVTLADRCAGLVLVDGGWEDLEETLDMDADEFLRGLDEPPEVMRSMRAFLADRRDFDPSTWDADQEVAARATVVETHAGRVVPATRPHALEACVRAMFTYRPVQTLTAVTAPVVAVCAADPDGRRRAALSMVSSARVATGLGAIESVTFESLGHNLMRYRPDAIVDAIGSLSPRS